MIKLFSAQDLSNTHSPEFLAMIHPSGASRYPHLITHPPHPAPHPAPGQLPAGEAMLLGSMPWPLGVKPILVSSTGAEPRRTPMSQAEPHLNSESTGRGRGELGVCSRRDREPGLARVMEQRGHRWVRGAPRPLAYSPPHPASPSPLPWAGEGRQGELEEARVTSHLCCWSC